MAGREWSMRLTVPAATIASGAQGIVARATCTAGGLVLSFDVERTPAGRIRPVLASGCGPSRRVASRWLAELDEAFRAEVDRAHTAQDRERAAKDQFARWQRERDERERRAQEEARQRAAPPPPPRPDPSRLWTVLGLPGPVDRLSAQMAYRRAAFQAHPDHGGSHEAFIRLGRTWEAIKQVMSW